MKKKHVYSTVIILLLIYSIYWIRYERVFSSLKSVPKESTAIFQINLRNIEHAFLIDFLKNPVRYLKKNDSLKPKKKRSSSLISLLDFPRNLVFYTTDSIQPSIFYSESLQIKDTLDFQNYLKNNGYKKIKNQFNSALIYSKNHHSFILRKAMVNIGLHRSKLFPQKKIATILLNNAKNSSLKTFFSYDNTSDFQFWSQNTGVFYGAFSNGYLNFRSSSYTVVPSKTKNNKKEIAYIHGNLKNLPFFEGESAKYKKTFKKLTNSSLDSIHKYWTGNIELNVYALKTITDTIISYTYDDNFNQIEIKKLQQHLSPNLSLNFGTGNSPKLWSYFKKNNTLKQVNNDLLFTLIPLLPLKASYLNNDYFFYTDTLITPKTSRINTKGLQFFIDIAQIRENTQWKLFKNKQLQQISSIEGNLDQNKQLNIRFNCNDSHRNGLIQLLKN